MRSARFNETILEQGKAELQRKASEQSATWLREAETILTERTQDFESTMTKIGHDFDSLIDGLRVEKQKESDEILAEIRQQKKKWKA